jgi:hypothetical protein
VARELDQPRNVSAKESTPPALGVARGGRARRDRELAARLLGAGTLDVTVERERGGDILLSRTIESDGSGEVALDVRTD